MDLTLETASSLFSALWTVLIILWTCMQTMAILVSLNISLRDLKRFWSPLLLGPLPMCLVPFRGTMYQKLNFLVWLFWLKERLHETPGFLPHKSKQQEFWENINTECHLFLHWSAGLCGLLLIYWITYGRSSRHFWSWLCVCSSQSLQCFLINIVPTRAAVLNPTEHPTLHYPWVMTHVLLKSPQHTRLLYHVPPLSLMSPL